MTNRSSNPQARQSIRAHLDAFVAESAVRGDDRDAGAVAATVLAMAGAVGEIADLLALGALAAPFGAATGRYSAADPQRELDVLANDKVIEALADSAVALLISEELDDPLPMAREGTLAVAVDPLDGASNADTNAAIGTIFSIFPRPGLVREAGGGPALTAGDRQLAAGFAVYGPQTLLVLTLGAGTHVFTLDPVSRVFLMTAPCVRIPDTASEFAINAANHFHWDDAIRSYVDGCLRLQTETGKASVNMRWTGSFVAEICRILVRGGVYLYPADARPAYRNGRLRLAYEASPVAFIVEQAGGAASTGRQRILDVPVREWHQRTPVVAGSRSEVEAVARLHDDPFPLGQASPLFSRRGLFRV